ncbi:MAG: type secretion protein EvpB/family [Panacagrimonas sp.]|jgi:type VI secretion system ImpC/EvpB family protein|nr:type VI secretion system contractile sheath large subunit [Panacagrimonas sp.]MCC2658998.1 type secretion protein EvpB/family [Panacagrimonas sp.]
MPTKGMSFDLGFGAHGAPRREPEAPMRLLLVGDFSGRPAGDRPALATRPTQRVDLEELDRVFSRLAPRIAAAVSQVEPRSIDDLHPDALFANLDLFRALRAARTQPPPASASAAAASDESPLSALLGGKPAGVSAAAAAAPAGGAQEGIEALIRRVVAPHIVPDRLAETRSYVAAVDSAIAEQMRQLLHDPAFQRCEIAWRGAQWLVSRLDLDESLQLHLFDVSRDELLADLAAAGGQVRQSGLYRALVDRWRNQPGAQGWSALIGLFRFGAADVDVGLLAALGIVAAQAGAPFLAEGDPALADADASPATRESWNALRTSEVGRWIGLVAPRLMLRRPYGARDEKIDAFDFEELGNKPAHEHYLWGSGALAAAMLLGRAYRAAEGWSFEPNADRGIEDLPSATRIGDDGDKELVPSAERFLADSHAERLLAAGLMPLLSHRHLNAAQLMRFQSVALPAAPLAGLPD